MFYGTATAFGRRRRRHRRRIACQFYGFTTLRFVSDVSHSLGGMG